MTKPIDLDRILKLASLAIENPEMAGTSFMYNFKNACDPTTITALVKELKEAREVLEFYASPLSWDYNQTRDDMTAIESSDHSTPDQCCEHRGGKLARAFQEKWGLK